MSTTTKRLTIGRPIMSGFCNFPQTAHPEESHARCAGGSTANPRGVFHPCPCPHHFGEERFECENCGGELAEAPHWPLDYDDVPEGEPGEIRYTHIDRHTGRATGEMCG